MKYLKYALSGIFYPPVFVFGFVGLGFCLLFLCSFYVAVLFMSMIHYIEDFLDPED